MIDLTKIQPPDVHADSFMVGAFVSLTSRVGPALPPGVETKPQDLRLRSFKGSRYSSGPTQEGISRASDRASRVRRRAVLGTPES